MFSGHFRAAKVVGIIFAANHFLTCDDRAFRLNSVEIGKSMNHFLYFGMKVLCCFRIVPDNFHIIGSDFLPRRVVHGECDFFMTNGPYFTADR